MDKILLIIKREYWVNVRQKSFIIMTILAPFLMVLFTAVVVYIGLANRSEKNIAVIDESTIFTTQLHNERNLKFQFFEPKDEPRLMDSVLHAKEGDYTLIHIPKPKDSLFSNFDKDITIMVSNDLDQQTKGYLSGKFKEIIEQKKREQLGISKEKLQQSVSNINFNILNISNNEDEGNSSEIKLVLGSTLAYLVFMFIMIYGVRVMRSVIEEKNSRIIEVIISSVKPMQLMIGKIIGIALVALTQFVIWIVLFLSLSVIYQKFIAQPIPADAMKMPNADRANEIAETIDILFHLNFPFIIVTFLLFFCIGYLLFSAIFAAIGSAVDNETETQQFTMIGILPLMIGGYGSFTSIMTNPDGNILAFLSMFPLTSPVSMVIRSPYNVPIWQWLVSIILLIITTIGMIYLASKIYRVGILMHGKKASFKEIYKWMRY